MFYQPVNVELINRRTTVLLNSGVFSKLPSIKSTIMSDFMLETK